MRWPDAPAGEFHAVVSAEGYAPDVLPFLRIGPQSQVVEVVLVPGFPAVIEAAAPEGAGMLQVIEPQFGLKVADAIIPFPAGRVQRRVFRLKPGNYGARLSIGIQEVVSGSFVQQPPGSPRVPLLRLEGSELPR